jgi:hypothetical protein
MTLKACARGVDPEGGGGNLVRTLEPDLAVLPDLAQGQKKDRDHAGIWSHLTPHGFIGLTEIWKQRLLILGGKPRESIQPEVCLQDFDQGRS